MKHHVMGMLALQALIMVPVTPCFNTDDNLDYSDTVHLQHLQEVWSI